MSYVVLKGAEPSIHKKGHMSEGKEFVSRYIDHKVHLSHEKI